MVKLKTLMYNKSMQKMRYRSGFTVIEVILVLAISTALAMAILSTITGNIHRQRFLDSYTDLANYLRSAYSSTVNVQNPRLFTEESGFSCTINSIWDENGRLSTNTDTDNYPGRSRCAIYGKLITFGENDPITGTPTTKVHMYDIIGRVYTGQMNIENSTGDNAINSLKAVAANVVTLRSAPNSCRVHFAGQESSYTPQWQARIEQASDQQLLRGAIMIVRSPVSGTVHTYTYDQPGQTFDVAQLIETLNHNAPAQSCETASLEQYRPYANNALLYGALGEVSSGLSILQYELKNSKMQNKQDFTLCVSSDDIPLAPKRRRPIRIKADGNNSSAVQLVDIDSHDNPCQ